jgi:predicted RNA polymerase sigma factor
MADDAALVHSVLDDVVRREYGRLVGALSCRWRDLTSVEDAVSDAVARALATWPRDGIPERPAHWLHTVASRRLLDGYRRDRVRDAYVASAAGTPDAESEPSEEWGTGADPRLPLLFVCAHPAIERNVRTPLMLQTVLGLTAEQIAGAFLVQPDAMGKRLGRAKLKIRDAGIPFAIPDATDWPERLDAVLDAVYAAYGVGWDELASDDDRPRDLAQDGLWLARVLVELLPDQGEARGVLSVMLFCESRRSARRTADGVYVPLDAQDAHRWDARLIDEAERHLHHAASLGGVGRFQLEAAIQSWHVDRRRQGDAQWTELVALYRALVSAAPTIAAQLGLAAALARVGAPAEALRMLDDMPAAATADHQPYWAVRADLLARLGNIVAAREAYRRAAGLATDVAVRDFLLAREAELSASGPA